MKAVQVGILAGILVALLVCAGLLFKIYRGQQAPPTPPVAAAPATPPVAAPVAEPAAPTAPVPATETQPSPQPEKPAAPPRKPSPMRAPKEQAAEPVATNQPPAEPTPAEPAPAAPAPTPPPTPPAEQTSQPEPPPPPVLNPPSGTDTEPPPPRTPHTVTIPANTVLAVRLNEALSSDKNHPGDTFAATLDQPLVVDGFVIAERGARIQGKVLESEKAGHGKGGSSLSVHLTQLHTSDGQEVGIETERYHKEGASAASDDVKKVGAGAIIGAAIGAIAGGGKGAAIGAGVGAGAGGGVAAATRGKPVELPVETRIAFHLAQPVTLTERLD